MSETLVQFAARYGVIIDRAPIPGRWCRYKTEGKGSKRNGAVHDMGGVVLVQNWETMDKPAVWSRDGNSIDRDAIRKAMQRDAKETARRRADGAAKAREMLAAAQDAPHPYLDRKGFPERRGWVLDEVLLVPMLVGNRVVNVQRISADGTKRFIFGAQASGATYELGAVRRIHAPDDVITVWCEGYATGLAILEALQLSAVHVQVIVTFSAGNLANIARNGIVFADNDASGTGQRAAEATGLPWIMAPEVGEDAADMRVRLGRAKFSTWIKTQILRLR